MPVRRLQRRARWPTNECCAGLRRHPDHPPDPGLRDVGGRSVTGTVGAEVGTRQHRHATRFFWGWLLGATLVSLAGNMTHAWMAAPSSTRWLAVAVAAVPPAVLLAAVHGVAVLVGAGAGPAGRPIALP